MKKWSTLIPLLILTGALCVSATAVAAEGTASTGKDSLNLTREQHQQIQTLRQNRWNDLKPLRSRLIAKFNELKSLLTLNSPEQKSLLKEKQTEIQELQRKLHEKMATYRMELRRILTKEQQSLLPSYGLERGYFRSSSDTALHDTTAMSHPSTTTIY